MALAVAIACALVMLALLPFILAGLVLTASGTLEAFVRLLAWIFRPLASIIGWWNRLTYRICFRIGRSIRPIINRIRKVAQ